jgi:hypothetical protein
MSADPIKIRRKEMSKTKKSKFRLVFVGAFVFAFCTIAAFAFAAFSGKFAALDAPIEIISDGNRRIIRVPANGNLQEAVNQANSGDVIELQAGAAYSGEIKLPNKNLTDFVTIRSSAIAKLPENARVSPKQSNLMAKIVSGGAGKPAISTENGAHHYRFEAIEFESAPDEYVYNLVYLAAETDKTADVPRDLEFDRCYFHSNATGKTRRGVALNSANTTIKNSFLEGFAFPQEETQAICGWTGTKNAKIINNYIEAGAENVMFGGADPANAELIPQDIEIRGNHFNKPAEWKNKNTVKCLFELKNARRVEFVGNYLENNWVGSAFRITVRNQDGKAPFSTIEDVTIKDNVIEGAGEAVNVLGKDDTYPSQTLKNLTISNNIFLDIGAEKFEGSGYFMQISGGENILITNNTIFNSGNVFTFYGDVPKNLLFRHNITGYGKYGIHGLNDLKSAQAQQFFRSNLFVNNRKIPDSDFIIPPNNFSAPNFSEVGFADLAKKDFRLAASSKFRDESKRKNHLGSSLDYKSIAK